MRQACQVSRPLRGTEAGRGTQEHEGADLVLRGQRGGTLENDRGANRRRTAMDASGWCLRAHMAKADSVGEVGAVNFNAVRVNITRGMYVVSLVLKPPLEDRLFTHF